MKKFSICLVMIWLFMVLAGCGSTGTDIADSSNGNVDMESDSTNGTDTINNYISMTSKITQLESGFSVVRYDGDYAFDLFLEQGGASSDQDVLQFLTANMFKRNAGLQISGEAFGCSTISVENADGGYLFGRNFDWQTCDALVIAAYPEEGYASIATGNLGFIKQGAGFAANFLTD